MRWWSRFVRARIFNDLSEEIQQHLREKEESLVAQGISREEAAFTAKREFGNVTGVEERGRDTWVWPIDRVWMDTKFGLRQLRKNFGFTATVVLTLALGIGVTAAIFSLVDAVLLRRLPFPEQSRLMWLNLQDHSLPGVIPESLSYPDFFDWRSRTRTFSGMAAYASTTAILQSQGQAQHLDAMMVSSDLFDVLRVAPMLGRDFRREDEKPGNRAVMLSYSLWQSTFGTNPDIVGKEIRIGDHSYVVAGVMPKDFRFPLTNPAPALWMSIAEAAEGKNPQTSQRGFECLDVIGRLRPGITPDQAKADLSLIASQIARQYPDSNKRFSSALVEPELRHITGNTKPALIILFGAVLLVLLIACANVAGLLLARGSRRSAEFALRASLGASRGAMIRQSLVESLVLALCGGITGIALAFAMLRSIVRLMPLDIPRIENASIDGTVLLFLVFISMIAGLLFGVLPAWRMSNLGMAPMLHERSRSVAGGGREHRVHTALVVAQTAIGLILLISSGLLIRSFVRILNVDPGFDPHHVLTARIGLSFDTLSHDRRLQFYAQLLQRIAAMPGVQSASAGWPLPMSDSHATISFSIQGRMISKADEPDESIGIVLPGYFATMRIPLISGRTFQEQDGTKTLPVMVINQAFARKYFPHENPIGKHIRVELGDGVVDHAVREVVGVVGDIKGRGLTSEAAPEYYLPFSQAVVTNPFLTVRTSGDSKLLEPELRAAVQAMDKSVPIYQISTLEEYVMESAAQPRFQAFLLTCFAGIALLLAAIGLYGLLTYMVVQRAREIGLRMALGARRGDVLGMIIRRGLALIAIGLAIGLMISALTARLLSTMLYGVGPSDPVAFVAMIGVLIVVSLLASSIPAYRAARLDPVETLREQ